MGEEVTANNKTELKYRALSETGDVLAEVDNHLTMYKLNPQLLEKVDKYVVWVNIKTEAKVSVIFKKKGPQ